MLTTTHNYGMNDHGREGVRVNVLIEALSRSRQSGLASVRGLNDCGPAITTGCKALARGHSDMSETGCRP